MPRSPGLKNLVHGLGLGLLRPVPGVHQLRRKRRDFRSDRLADPGGQPGVLSDHAEPGERRILLHRLSHVSGDADRPGASSIPPTRICVDHRRHEQHVRVRRASPRQAEPEADADGTVDYVLNGAWHDGGDEGSFFTTMYYMNPFGKMTSDANGFGLQLRSETATNSRSRRRAIIRAGRTSASATARSSSSRTHQYMAAQPRQLAAGQRHLQRQHGRLHRRPAGHGRLSGTLDPVWRRGDQL